MTETLSINDRKYNLKGISPVAVLVCLLFDEMWQGCVERLYLDVWSISCTPVDLILNDGVMHFVM